MAKSIRSGREKNNKSPIPFPNQIPGEKKSRVGVGVGIRFSNAVYQLSYNIFILGALMKFKINNEACTSFKIEKIKLLSASGLRQTPWRAGRSEQNDNHGGVWGTFSQLQIQHLVVPASVCFFYYKKLRIVAKFIPSPAVSFKEGKTRRMRLGYPRLPPSLSPPPLP